MQKPAAAGLVSWLPCLHSLRLPGMLAAQCRRQASLDSSTAAAADLGCAQMPTLHRLSVFRDDLVFLVYLYQRWIYRVDKKRANEFGCVFKAPRRTLGVIRSFKCHNEQACYAHGSRRHT